MQEVPQSARQFEYHQMKLLQQRQILNSWRSGQDSNHESGWPYLFENSSEFRKLRTRDQPRVGAMHFWTTSTDGNSPEAGRKIPHAVQPLSGRAPAREERPVVSFRIGVGAWSAAVIDRLFPHCRTCCGRGVSGHHGPRPYVASGLRVQARQRWPRYPCDPGLSRAPQPTEYDAVYGAGTAVIQEASLRLKAEDREFEISYRGRIFFKGLKTHGIVRRSSRPTKAKNAMPKTPSTTRAAKTLVVFNCAVSCDIR
jgi:hypothetical protein